MSGYLYVLGGFACAGICFAAFVIGGGMITIRARHTLWLWPLAVVAWFAGKWCVEAGIDIIGY